MPATYEPIATTTLGSASATITFSSIASSWTDLRAVLVGTADGVTVSLRFNSDTTSVYSYTRIKGDGSTASSSRFSNDNRLLLTSGTGLSSTIQLFTADIFSYAGSTFKTALGTASQDENGTGDVVRTVGLWRNTSAITSVSLVAGAGSFNAGTTATLYGIKNA